MKERRKGKKGKKERNKEKRKVKSKNHGKRLGWVHRKGNQPSKGLFLLPTNKRRHTGNLSR